MSELTAPQNITIRTVYERGWLKSIFEPVCDTLIAQRGQPKTAIDVLGKDADPAEVKALNAIITDGRYPPVCPEEIVEVIEEAHHLISDAIVNETVRLSMDMRRIISRKLHEYTGIDYRVC